MEEGACLARANLLLEELPLGQENGLHRGVFLSKGNRGGLHRLKTNLLDRGWGQPGQGHSWLHPSAGGPLNALLP